MRSHEHAAVGAVVSIALVGAAGVDPVVGAAALAYGVGLSVFVDLDHFLVARVRTGDWSRLRRALADPVWAFTDQEAVFAGLDIARERLFSHVAVGNVLVAGLAAVSTGAAALTAVVLGAHVACDLLRDHEIA